MIAVVRVYLKQRLGEKSLSFEQGGDDAESGPTEVSGPVHRGWRILAEIVSCKITDSI